ncbi:biotin--protein ligase [Nephila pilipes]|uniref:Biotin--protein ligase n=1 Tax=Nephila pilipes TaxID=299642 RepID=A0A8X6NTB6_NEPPI|nr:biotin--protein ligase [Nephila pilipes]
MCRKTALIDFVKQLSGGVRFNHKQQIFEQKRLFQSSKMSGNNTVMKPPNVLVYLGEKEQKVFDNISINLMKCLNKDKYVVYELKKSQVLGSPWKENTALLVMFSEEIESKIAEAFRDYVENEGKILIFCSNFDHTEVGLNFNVISGARLVKINYKTILDVPICQGKFSYRLKNSVCLATNSEGEPCILKSMHKSNNLIVSSVHLALDSSLLEEGVQQDDINRLHILKNILCEELGLETDCITIPAPTPGYILVDKEELLYKLQSKRIKEIYLGKLEKSILYPNEPPGSLVDIKVPILFENEFLDAIPFNRNVYFSNLKCKHLGAYVAFFPVITSTMIAAECLRQYEGIVVVAGRQVSGRGRSDNKWISPEGGAMFTLHLSFLLSSRLGQRMPILQHMASLAVVHGIRKNPIYSKLDLRLKWPNDLFYETDKKIGGILVNTTLQGNEVVAFIGIGVNVANEQPTVCINSIIHKHNETVGDSLPLLSIEEVIALTLSELESLIDDFQQSGPEKFLSLYYSYWLHQDQRVTLSSMNKEATIRGLDEYGFLVVNTDDGKNLTLQPDGNRFDIMKNLITSRK